MSDDKEPGFESRIEQLEELVRRLEGGELKLEDSLAAFEQGVKLVRAAQKSLTEAEQKVSLLLSENGEPQLEPFHDEPFNEEDSE